MLASILGFITGLGPIISSLGGKIADLQLAKAQAKSNVEIQEINAEIEATHDRRAVLVAEAGNRLAAGLNASARLLLALGPILVLLKLMVWDKVIGSFNGCALKDAVHYPGCNTFRTDPLDANQWIVITAVIGFYFLYSGINRIKQ